VAAQTEPVNFLAALYRELCYFFTVFDMIPEWAVTDFAGDSVVNPLFMNGAHRFVALKARIVGPKPDRYVFLVLDICPAIMPILAHAFRDKESPCKVACNSDQDQSYDHLDHVGVIFGF